MSYRVERFIGERFIREDIMGRTWKIELNEAELEDLFYALCVARDAADKMGRARNSTLERITRITNILEQETATEDKVAAR